MKLPNIITISGLPASGKSTLAKLMAKKYHYKYLVAGKYFRALAKQKNMTIEEFEIYCLKNLQHDIEIDKKMIRYIKTHKKVIYDGHISGWMAKRGKAPSLKLWLNVPKYIRVERLAKREKISKAKAREFINHREKFLKKRYKMLYNIDYYDSSIYNVIVNGKPLPKDILKNINNTLKALTGSKK